MGRLPKYGERAARDAIAASLSWSDSLRRLGLRPAGGNFRTLQKWALAWGIDTSHFDPLAGRRAPGPRVPLEEILVEHSTFSRGHLKQRLYDAGIKRPVCELCGQSELWHGRPMALVLDHINGVGTDHRLTNLRIVCPNCAATLDTHCGRNIPRRRQCAHCGEAFRPKLGTQRYCSRRCSGPSDGRRAALSRPYPERRKVARPPYEQLVADVRCFGYVATGRRYGVSDNAVRKWIRWYERDRAAAEDEEQQAA